MSNFWDEWRLSVRANNTLLVLRPASREKLIALIHQFPSNWYAGIGNIGKITAKEIEAAAFAEQTEAPEMSREELSTLLDKYVLHIGIARKGGVSSISFTERELARLQSVGD